jgi:glycerol kinase
VRPAVRETTALGAAYAAGLGLGVYSSPEELRSLWRADRTFEPSWPASRRDEAFALWRRAVERAKGWRSPAGGASAGPSTR